MQGLGVIADDLTGACDVAGAFATAGLSGTVDLGGTFCAVPEAHVLVFDANVRDASEGSATQGLRAGVARLAARGFGLHYLKVDSTLRGPIGPLVREALALGVARGAVVATAFPAQGRTVSRGRLLVHGRDAGVEALQAVGPGARLTSSSEVLDAGSGPAVYVLAEQGEEELERLARTWTATPDGPLLVGSAGLARHLAPVLASRMGARPVRPDVGQAPSAATRSGWALVVCGSPTPESTRQLAELRTAIGPDREWGRLEVELLAAPPGAARDDGSVAAALALEARKVLDERGSPPSAVVLAGGDTGRAVLDALEVAAVRIVGEVSAGVPMGYAIGGVIDGVALATKAGGFGGDDMLTKMLATVCGASPEVA